MRIMTKTNLTESVLHKLKESYNYYEVPEGLEYVYSELEKRFGKDWKKVPVDELEGVVYNIVGIYNYSDSNSDEDDIWDYIKHHDIKKLKEGEIKRTFGERFFIAVDNGLISLVDVGQALTMEMSDEELENMCRENDWLQYIDEANEEIDESTKCNNDLNEGLGKGYVGQSMSVNATEAKEENEVPLSDITKDLLLDLEINETVAFIKWLMQRLGRTSYHHTGKYYNETDFYDINRYFELSEEEIQKYKEEYNVDKQEAKEDKPDEYEATITYQVWEGKYKNYRRPVEYTSDCVVKGNWAYLPDGTKKNITGNSVISVKKK